MQVISSPQQGIRSLGNSTSIPLANGATFTGEWELNGYPDVLISIVSDTGASASAQFSNDGVTVHSSVSFIVAANVPEFHRLVKGSRYFRITITNSFGGAQSSLNALTSYGFFAPLTSNLNSTVRQDSDALLVRTFDPRLDIVSGRFDGISVVSKAGRNSDVDSGTLPEDVWEGGGAFTGFIASPVACSIASTNAGDTGVVTYTYLATSDDTAYSTGTVTLTGTTSVSIGNLYRVHTMSYNNSNATTFNAGTISIYETATPANVLQLIIPGVSQSNGAGFTMPAGSTGYISRYGGSILGGTASYVDGSFWIRGFGQSPRLRRPFTLNATPYSIELQGAIVIPAKADVIPRITGTSGNNLSVNFNYGIELVRDS